MFDEFPCSLQHIENGKREAKQFRKQFEQAAQEAGEAWQCPCVGFPLPAHTGALPSGAQKVLDDVETLGIEPSGFKTCPLFYIRTGTPTGNACEIASVDFEAYENGSWGDIDDKPQCRIDAVTLIKRYRSQCEVLESDLRRQKQEQKQKEIQASFNRKRGINDPI